MGRFLLLWISLAVPLAVTTFAISTIGFRNIDLRYVTFVQLLAIPTFQAAVLTWVRRQWSLSRWIAAARRILSHRWIACFVALDAGVLVLGVAAHGIPMVGIDGHSSLHLKWAAVKALIAAGLLAAAAFRSDDGDTNRAWLLGLAGVVLAISSGVFVPWLVALPQRVEWLGPMVIRWLVVYGGLSILGLLALCQVSTKVRPHSPAAAFSFDLTAACVFSVALVCTANIFLRPFLVEPWVSIVRSLFSIGATALLVGSWLLLATRDHDRTGPPRSR